MALQLPCYDASITLGMSSCTSKPSKAKVFGFLSASMSPITIVAIFACQLAFNIHVYSLNYSCAALSFYGSPHSWQLCLDSLEGILACTCISNNGYSATNNSEVISYGAYRQYDTPTITLAVINCIFGGFTLITMTIMICQFCCSSKGGTEQASWFTGFLGGFSDFFALMGFMAFKLVYYMAWHELPVTAWMTFFASLYGIVHVRLPTMIIPHARWASWYTFTSEEVTPYRVPTAPQTADFWRALNKANEQCCKVPANASPEVTFCLQCCGLLRFVLVPLTFVIFLLVGFVEGLLIHTAYFLEAWATMLYLMLTPSGYGINVRVLICLVSLLVMPIIFGIALLIEWVYAVGCAFCGAFVLPFVPGHCSLLLEYIRERYESLQRFRQGLIACRANLPQVHVDYPILILPLYGLIPVASLIILFPFMAVWLVYRLPTLCIHVIGRYMQKVSEDPCCSCWFSLAGTAGLLVYTPLAYLALLFVELPIWTLYGAVEGWCHYSPQWCTYPGLKAVVEWCLYMPYRFDKMLVDTIIAADPGTDKLEVQRSAPSVWWLPEQTPPAPLEQVVLESKGDPSSTVYFHA